MKINSRTSLLLVLVFLLASPAGAEDSAKKALTLNGATAAASVVAPLAAEYEALNQGQAVCVYGSTDGKGLEALLAKRADIAMAGFSLTPAIKEKATQIGMLLEEVLICHDTIPIIVHPSNPINELTLDQVRDIFAGRLTSWKDVGGPDQPITVVTMPPDTGMAKFLKNSVFKTDFSPKAYEVSTNMAAKVVQGRPWAIGFTRLDVGTREHKEGNLKMLSIKKDASSPAIASTEENVLKERCPILRPLFLVYDGKTAGNSLRDFVAYCQKKVRDRNAAKGFEGSTKTAAQGGR